MHCVNMWHIENILTRNMGQSPTWGHPAPRVWLEILFMGLVGVSKIWEASTPLGVKI